ncbi:hypothetical protein KSP40_PGU011882 [Platanthera guangdongensis]|uniref:Uncharacterized protein n=1 Tax=Platanthera guangdongensis TaxID=2320717 RepID=A0ABR2MI17_9ASPA
MKLTVNEVALVLGLPNSGVPFKFTRSPILDLTHKCLNEKLREVTEEEWSPALEERRISLIIKYLLCMFFFPLKNLKVPACLDAIKDIQDFVKYNWPQAIHGFLHSQFDGLSKICKVRGADYDAHYLVVFNRNMLIIECGNISMSRGDLDDLLGVGWVMDSHLNAYSMVLGARRKKNPDLVRSFLYVSPNHAVRYLNIYYYL